MNVSLSLEASYFNEKVAEWEPLIEPVTADNSQRPMGFDISVSCILSLPFISHFFAP